jgi:hypothetical protein
MVDREVSANTVVASVLWLLAFILWGVSLAWGGPPLRSLAIMVCAAGATATVRSYVIRLGQQIKVALAAMRAADLPRLH